MIYWGLFFRRFVLESDCLVISGHHKKIQPSNNDLRGQILLLITGFLLYIHSLSTIIGRFLTRNNFSAVDNKFLEII